jgi:hypothetical protein
VIGLTDLADVELASIQIIARLAQGRQGREAFEAGIFGTAVFFAQPLLPRFYPGGREPC